MAAVAGCSVRGLLRGLPAGAWRGWPCPRCLARSSSAAGGPQQLAQHSAPPQPGGAGAAPCQVSDWQPARAARGRPPPASSVQPPPTTLVARMQPVQHRQPEALRSHEIQACECVATSLGTAPAQRPSALPFATGDMCRSCPGQSPYTKKVTTAPHPGVRLRAGAMPRSISSPCPLVAATVATQYAQRAALLCSEQACALLE